MNKDQRKNLRVGVLCFAGIQLLMSFLSFTVKIAYKDYSPAAAQIIFAGFWMSVVAITFIKNKTIFNVITGIGLVFCNVLFFYSFKEANWATSAINGIKWIFVFFQVYYLFLFASRVLLKKVKIYYRLNHSKQA